MLGAGDLSSAEDEFDDYFDDEPDDPDDAGEPEASVVVIAGSLTTFIDRLQHYLVLIGKVLI